MPAETPKFAGKYRSAGFVPTDKPSVLTPVQHPRETPRPPSRNAADTTFAAKRDTNKYTGTAVIGVVAMHKSNLVPVFNQDAAIDAAKMRRS